jgi:tRNA dimethylallyltransferase
MTSSDIPTPPPRVLAVVGPTAVGKTALAEELAVRLNGEIVSADSMQVYRGMDIGTAKPPLSERRVPYHCLDLTEPGEAFSAALFQHAARAAIADIAGRGKLPVVAGGTGLYVRAALDPMEFPAGEQRENEARARYEAYAAEHGADALYALLAERDPESAAAVHANNVRRVVRALEMADEGVSYARQREGFSARESVYEARFVGLTMTRERLYERVDARVDAMVAAGLLGEVRELLDAGLRDAITASQAIGYKELVPVIEGGADLDEAVCAVKQASRRYAKRQLTWFSADPRVRWIDVTELSLSKTADAAMGTLDW